MMENFGQRLMPDGPDAAPADDDFLAERIGDFRPEIIIDLVDGFSHGIGHFFRLLAGRSGDENKRQNRPDDQDISHGILHILPTLGSFCHTWKVGGKPKPARRNSRPGFYV